MLTERFNEALVFAAKLHSRQTRKQTTIPYVSHLLIVAGTVLEHGADEDTAIAALLHDAIEDQGGQNARDLIRSQFGLRVVEMVESVSDTDQDPKPPWRKRKFEYLVGLATKSREGLLIAVADKLHNARSTLLEKIERGEAVWEKFNAPKRDQEWFYSEFVDQVRESCRGPEALIDELERVLYDLFDWPTDRAPDIVAPQ